MTTDDCRQYHFLALISPTGEAYVVQTSTTDFRRLYKRHWEGHNSETARLFFQGRPSMFLLETVDLSGGKAHGRRIQWTRVLHDCGYSMVDWTAMRPYIECPYPDDPSTYAQLRRRDLQKLLAPECDLSAAFCFKECTHTIKLTVSPDEWRELRREASDIGLPLDAYVRARFDCGTVTALSLSELQSCEQQCRQVAMLLEHKRRLEHLRGENCSQLQVAVDALHGEIRALTTAIREYVEVRK